MTENINLTPRFRLYVSACPFLFFLSSNDIKCYDLRTNRLLFSLIGHRDSVTGLSISPDGSYLLSNGMDSTLRCWDVRPYVAAPTRLTCIYKGHTHDLEQNLLRCAWNMDGTKVTAGSADQTVNIWYEIIDTKQNR